MLKLLDAKSVVSGMLIAGGAWSIRFPTPEKIKFWGIVKGRCWLETSGEGGAIELQTGDVLLMLRSAPMTLTSELGLASVSLNEVLSLQTNEISRIGDGEDFVMIGGTVVLDPSGPVCCSTHCRR